MTHTYALLEVSPEAYKEIRDRLIAAGSAHAINSDGEIDLHGIGLAQGLNLDGLPTRAPGLHCATCQCNKLPPTPPVPSSPRSRSWHQNALTEPPK